MDITVPATFPSPADLSDHRVVLTGATRGLGRVLAHAFAARGARMVLVSRSESSLKDLASSLPGEHVWIAGDISDEACNEAAADRAVVEFGGLDAWIGNAGVSTILSSPQDTSVEAWRRLLDVNLTGTFLGARAAAGRMKAGGSIVVTSSVLARRPMAGLSAYSASKAGVEAMVASMAQDLAPSGIRVNAVAPGWFDSPMAQPFSSDPARAKYVLERTALGRWGSPEDLPGAFIFLMSPAARFITGAVIPVDGGYVPG